MTNPTLRALAELPLEPPSLAASTLVMIDCQNTYTRGVMELDGVSAALDEAAALLDRARTAGIPIIHIQHSDGPSSLYDNEGETGAIALRVAPGEGEPVVVRNYPNSFVQTDLVLVGCA
jgi:nicotinamidase-related amidase